MNKYKRLATNSFIFAIGNLGSKLITFLLVPLYTYYLTTDQYGVVDLITTTISLMLPVITLSISEAVLRWIMDKTTDKVVVLNNAIALTMLGFLFSLSIFPILDKILPFSGYIIYFYVLLIVQCINSSFMQFTRANNQIKAYAFTGILSSIVTVIANVILLVIYHMGIKGYLVSMILANLSILIFLFFIGHIYKYINIGKVNKDVLKSMLVYSIPLIPNFLMWWLMNVSDRYIILFFVGVSANGLYAVANKIPTILSTLDSIFYQAWQMSAIEEANSKDKSQFFSNVFAVLSSFMLMGTSALIAFLKVIMHILVSPAYYTSWKFVPFLLLGVVFSCFSGFLGINYIAAKNTIGVFRTSIIGAIINVGLNLCLVPIIGVNGASISTMCCFLVIWLLRIVETRTYVRIKVNTKKLVANFGLIALQIVSLYYEISMFISVLIQCFLLFSLFMLNISEIKFLSQKMIKMLRKSL